VLLFASLLLTVLLVVAAFAVDLGLAREIQRQNQGGADASSLAGVQNLPAANPGSCVAGDPRSVAADYAARSISDGSSTPPVLIATNAPAIPSDGPGCVYQVGDATVTVTTPYVEPGSPIAPADLINVQICQSSMSVFASVIGHTGSRVCRRATARRVENSVGVGVIALNSACNGISGIDGTGGGGQPVNLRVTNGGAVISNASNGGSCDSLVASGHPKISAGEVLLADTCSGGPPDCGGILVPDPSVPGSTAPQLVQGAGQTPDPLAGLPTPTPPAAIGSCKTVAKVMICTPGSYPSGMTITSTTPVCLDPGLYYVDTGIHVSGNGTITACPQTTNPITGVTTPPSSVDTGSGILLYLDSGGIIFNGSATIGLPPPDIAPWKGVSIFAAHGNTSTVMINGTNGPGLGSIYVPDGIVNTRGTADVVINGLLIGSQILYGGTSVTTVNVPSDGPKLAPDIGLEE
jgi:hypothetical protein